MKRPNYPTTNLEELSPREMRHLIHNIQSYHQPSIFSRLMIIIILLAIIGGIIYGLLQIGIQPFPV